MKKIVVAEVLCICLLMSACGANSTYSSTNVSGNTQEQILVEEVVEPEPEPIVTYSRDEIAEKFKGNKLSVEGLYLEFIGRINYIDKISYEDGYYMQLLNPYDEDDLRQVYCEFFGDDAKEQVIAFNKDDIVKVVGEITEVRPKIFTNDELDSIHITCEVCEKQ